MGGYSGAYCTFLFLTGESVAHQFYTQLSRIIISTKDSCKGTEEDPDNFTGKHLLSKFSFSFSHNLILV